MDYPANLDQYQQGSQAARAYEVPVASQPSSHRGRNVPIVSPTLPTPDAGSPRPEMVAPPISTQPYVASMPSESFLPTHSRGPTTAASTAGSTWAPSGATTPMPDALMPMERAWVLKVNSKELYIHSEHKDAWREKRGTLEPRRICLSDLLHDVISASLVPLTRHEYRDGDKLVDQASLFLSAFSDNAAVWEIDVSNIPHHEGETIYGMTVNSRDSRVAQRFLRFRFPFVRFEWHIETPYSDLQKLTTGSDPVRVHTLWKAWAVSGLASGLIGYGFIRDNMTLTENNHLVIQKREFVITKVFQPELMTPVPYPAIAPPLTPHHDFLIFSTSQTVIQGLRSSQRTMTFLVAISALFASVQPIVDRYSTAAGWVLAGLGISAAAISVVSVLIGLMLTWVEANAAKHRQS